MFMKTKDRGLIDLDKARIYLKSYDLAANYGNLDENKGG